MKVVVSIPSSVVVGTTAANRLTEMNILLGQLGQLVGWWCN